MKFNSILNRYLFKEMIPPFLISLSFLTFIFLMTRILKIADMIVNYSISPLTIALMLIYSMPFFLMYVIPMSTMLAVLLTFLRLSSDNEIIALKTGGVSLYGMLPPVLGFCLTSWVLSVLITVYGLPWGLTAFKKLVYQVVVSHADIGLKERTFNDSFEGVMLYVNKIDKRRNELIDVFIEEQVEKNIATTIVAPRGKLSNDPENMIFQLRLHNGSINQVDLENRTANSIAFETYDLNLDLEQSVTDFKQQSKHRREMTLGELRRYLKSASLDDSKYYPTLLEFHKRIALPFACFALGFLAMPLGIYSRTAKRSFGILLGLGFFLLYYLLASAANVFAETGYYPPLIGMWVPNIVLAGTAAYLIRKAAAERPLQIDFLTRIFYRFRSRCTCQM